MQCWCMYTSCIYPYYNDYYTVVTSINFVHIHMDIHNTHITLTLHIHVTWMTLA